MRLHSLDSIRGLAAAAVVLHHCTLALPGGAEDRAALAGGGFDAPWAWLYLTPLRLLVAGPVAVYIFFVLSGLVLAMTFVERDGDRYLPYLIKRVTRIWLPFVAAIVLSAVLMRVVGHDPLPGASDWFNFTWSQAPGRRAIADYLLMTGRVISLDNPMWSLVHELRISLVFPLLVLLCRRNWIATLAGSVVLGVAAARIMAHHPDWMSYASLLQTCTYLFMFVLGIGIALHSRALRRTVENMDAVWRAGLWLVAVAGLAVAPTGTMMLAHWRDILLTLGNAGAAALLIVLCIAEGRALAFLTGPVPRWLGRVSYSLYLTHVVVLVTVVRLLPAGMPLAVRLLLGAGLSLLVAAVFWRLVEDPAGRSGRWIAARVTARRDGRWRSGALQPPQ